LIFHWYHFTGGVDYEPGPYNVTFLPGTQLRFFTINIINDKLYEGNEIFNLSVDTSTLPRGIGYDGVEACVTIEDDECK